jgi:hypothetical protein
VRTRSTATGGAGRDEDDERADGFLIDVACRPHDADGPWKGASGFTKHYWEVVLREAANRRRFHVVRPEFA